MVRPSRAAAVKDGPPWGPPEGLVLVWGFRSQAHFARHSPFPSFQFLCSTLNPVSSPRPTLLGLPRTGAVKAGRRSALAVRSVVSRPRLDRPEHGGRLVVVGMTRPRGARCQGTRNSRRNLVSGGS